MSTNPPTDAEKQARMEASAAAVRDCEAYCKARGIWPVAVVGWLPGGTPVFGGEVLWVPVKVKEDQAPPGPGAAVAPTAQGCAHEWEQQPVLLTSDPPTSVFICTKCGAEGRRRQGEREISVFAPGPADGEQT